MRNGFVCLEGPTMELISFYFSPPKVFRRRSERPKEYVWDKEKFVHRVENPTYGMCKFCKSLGEERNANLGVYENSVLSKWEGEVEELRAMVARESVIVEVEVPQQLEVGQKEVEVVVEQNDVINVEDGLRRRLGFEEDGKLMIDKVGVDSRHVWMGGCWGASGYWKWNVAALLWCAKYLEYVEYHRYVELNTKVRGQLNPSELCQAAEWQGLECVIGKVAAWMFNGLITR
ncbi:hypothetical protein VNO78_06949 [Psophocarpus tetragonolobus]|uniref:Uncharacterized protein n=1 Tax=Psophocarpus tetragonolobus TaxID=3891 RepID=A0AAN9SSL2_PSOTE